jgi:hypothetical protein
VSRAGAAFTAEAAKSEVAPILLVRILNIPERNNPSNTHSLYLTDHGYTPEKGSNLSVYFDGQTYASCGVSFDNVDVGTTNEIDECKLRLDNVNRSFSALAQNATLKGVEVVVLRGFVETLLSPDGAQTLFRGHINACMIGESAIEATVTPDFSLQAIIPRRLYSVNEFPLIPSSKDPRSVLKK